MDVDGGTLSQKGLFLNIPIKLIQRKLNYFVTLLLFGINVL